MRTLHSTLISTLLGLGAFACAPLAFADDPPLPPPPRVQDGVRIEEVPQDQPPVTQPPPPPVDQSKEPPKKSIPVSLRVDGGYGIRSLEKLPVTGADIGVAIGAQPSKHFAVYGAARGFFGSTEGGLDVKALRMTVDMDVVIDRIRIGFDPGLFWVGVSRVTKDQTIVGWGPKIGIALRVDVFQQEPFAVFLRAAADAGATFSDGSMFGGFFIGAGLDFDIKAGNRSTL
jgi:hypothetical protein